MKPIARASAPVRLDFAGGWTDVPPFSAREGGVVVAGAIGLSAHAEVRCGGTGLRLVAEDLDDALELPDESALSPSGPLSLLQAGLRLLPVGPCALTTRSDAPPGSGLGSSGALDVALVAALACARGEAPSVEEIARLACHLEGVEAAIPGGRQDQYAAAFGGFLRLGFRDPDVTVEPLPLDAALLAELERRIVLVYTGASRFSGNTISRVMQAYERGNAGVTGALHGLREVAERMADTLRRGDLTAVGALLDANWRHQQTLDAGMCTSPMQRLTDAMRRAGALGGKAAGSGAGGSMFFLGPEDPEPARKAALALGMQILPVRWAGSGVRRC
ncbi:MAG: GHMP family kinase ATP-binding protein [Gemmatimonadales bacterium]